VGDFQSRYGGIKAMILRYDGSRWRRGHAANPGNPRGWSNRLFSVLAISNRDAWAFGLSVRSFTRGVALVEHWNGSRWSVVPTPAPSGSFISGSCRVADTGVVWAVGGVGLPASDQSLVMRWGGAHWRIVADALTNKLSHCVAAPSDAWAITPSGTPAPLEHWNGSTWASEAGPLPDSQAIAATNPTLSAIFIFGSGESALWTSAHPQWRLSTYPTAGIAPAAQDAAPAPSGMWLVGTGSIGSSTGSFIDRVTPTGWRTMWHLSGASQPALVAIARVPRRPTVWAVGSGIASAGPGAIVLKGP
jgi:hypothetical protein